MSSTGVRESNDSNKRFIKGLILNEAQFIQSLRIFANISTLSGLGATEGEINNSPVEASGNYLSRLGDSMLGPLALAPPLDFTIELDANNTIDIGPLNDNEQYTSNVQLDDIQPNGFVLDIIANAAFDGQLLFLRTFAPSSPFTISQGTLGNGGNIQTGDGDDLTVGDLQVVALIFDEALKIESNTGGSWRVLSVSSGGGSNVPDPTTEFQHLQSNDSNEWIAKNTFEFGALSANSAKVNFPNNTIGIAWRNASDDGNLEIKGTTAGNLDVTRDDNTSISLSIRSQNAIEIDQILSFTVGSGSVTSADTVIDASTARLLIAVGGATRLTLDVLATTDLTLKSPSGITAQSSFSVISTHATEADQNISMFVGSGNSADAVLTTSAGIFKIALTDTTRWEIDVNVGNVITHTAFNINPVYDLFNDDSSPNDFDLLARINFSGRNSVGSKITYASILADILDISNNTEDGSLSFSVIRAGVIAQSLALEPFIMKIFDSSMELDEVVLPTNPSANKGKIYLRDEGGITTPFFLDSTGTETSLISAGASGNVISQGNSNVTVNDVGVGTINFTVDGVAVGNITTAFGWVLDNSDLTITAANGKIIMNNGFEIENTNSTLTEFNIPAGETLRITEGLATRISITDDIIINCNLAGNITFQEFGVEVARYDGSADSWLFSTDIVLDGGSTTDYSDIELVGFASGTAEALPALPGLYIRMKVLGANIFVPGYIKP